MGRQSFLEAACPGAGGEAPAHHSKGRAILWGRGCTSPPDSPKRLLVGDEHAFPLGSLVTLMALQQQPAAHCDASRFTKRVVTAAAPPRPQGPAAGGTPPAGAGEVPAGLLRAVGDRSPPQGPSEARREDGRVARAAVRCEAES